MASIYNAILYATLLYYQVQVATCLVSQAQSRSRHFAGQPV
jgi:hypothetical protein